MDVFLAITWLLIFILSATVHEAAHAWAAKLGGDLTAYRGGQVSLDPIPHMKREPLGMVVFPLVSSFIFGWPFGYASAPYDPFWAHNHPRRAAWMAAAGPAANLLMVVLSVAAVKAGILAGVFMEPDSVGFRHIVDPAFQGKWAGPATLISMLFTLNLVMVVLNLIPFPPLDGANIMQLFLPDDAARKYQTVISNPVFGIVGFMLAWQVFGPIFEIVFRVVMNTVYWGAGYS